MIHKVLTGEIAEKILEFLRDKQEFECPQMPSGRALVLWHQGKFGECGQLVELQIQFVG